MFDKEWLGPLVAMLASLAFGAGWVWVVSGYMPQHGMSWGMAALWVTVMLAPAGAGGWFVFAQVYARLERIRGNRWYRKHRPEARAREVRRNRGS